MSKCPLLSVEDGKAEQHKEGCQEGQGAAGKDKRIDEWIVQVEPIQVS